MQRTNSLSSDLFCSHGRRPLLQGSRIRGRRIGLTVAGTLAASVVLATPASAASVEDAKPKASAAKADSEAEGDAASDVDAQEEELAKSTEPEDDEDGPEPEASPEDDGAAMMPDAAAGGAGKKAASNGMRNRIGLGAMRTLGGANALRVSWYAIDKLSVSALIGFATYTQEAQDADGDYTKKETYGLLAAGGDVLYWPVQGDRSRSVYADFGVGLRTTVFTGIRPPPDEDTGRRTKPMEVNVEIPVSLPIWFGQNVTVTPEFGFTARIVPGSIEPDTNGNADENEGQGTAERLGAANAPGWGVELGDNGGLFFGLSFAYVFGG